MNNALQVIGYASDTQCPEMIEALCNYSNRVTKETDDNIKITDGTMENADGKIYFGDESIVTTSTLNDAITINLPSTSSSSTIFVMPGNTPTIPARASKKTEASADPLDVRGSFLIHPIDSMCKTDDLDGGTINNHVGLMPSDNKVTKETDSNKGELPWFISEEESKDNHLSALRSLKSPWMLCGSKLSVSFGDQTLSTTGSLEGFNRVSAKPEGGTIENINVRLGG